MSRRVAGFWQDVSSQVRGDLIACVPAREFLLFSGTLEPGALSQMRAAARKITAGGDHLILVGHVENFHREERSPLIFHGGRYRDLA